MKEMTKRALIVAWVFVVAVFAFILIEEPEAWYAAAMLAAIVLAVQFIVMGFLNPARLARKD